MRPKLGRRISDASDGSAAASTNWDPFEWTKVERVSRSVPHGMSDFLLEAEDVIVEGHGVVLINTDEPGTLSVTNFRLLFVSEKSRNIIPLGTIPLAVIDKFAKHASKPPFAPRQSDKTPPRRLLQIVGKDMRIIMFGFRPKTKQNDSLRLDVDDFPVLMILNVVTTPHFVQANSLIACFEEVRQKKEINSVDVYINYFQGACIDLSFREVYAINNLYTALGSPSVPGWIPNAGDPCADGWQGVQCVGPNITAIILNDADLGGELGENLGIFTSIITIELSNNHIGGTIPENLPITLRELALNNNLLNGQLPDSFQSLGFLANLNLSFNNLSGQLPPSMQSLSSLTTMNIQNNQLSGTLDILQYLPLNYLNVENNLFSGLLPTQLASIPNFRKDGNLFNTTINPKSPAPSTSLEPAPVSPVNGFNELSGLGTRSRTPVAKNKKSYRRIIVIIVSVVASGIVLVLLTMVILNFFLSRQQERNLNQEKAPMRGGRMAYERPWMETGINTNSSVENSQVINREIPKTKVANATAEKPYDYDIDRSDSVVIVNPIELLETTTKMPLVKKPIYPTPSRPSTSAIQFSVASLQKYTDSFSEANIILENQLGKTYRADLPDGKKLMIMKIDIRESILSDDEFRNLALHVSELQHPNILELVGYCAEYGQRLLVYTYFSGRNLHDILHDEDDIRRNLSWNARIQVALGAARALEYLHEGCQLPIIHQKFESSNVLLDDELSVCVCDCGLASILSPSNSISQISSRICSPFSYEPPEIRDSGTHSDRSDVYSFGVVMLELLTGREPYDSSRPRSEQYLVRWASTQLHDINTLKRMVDSSIAGKYPVKSLSRFADIISRCIQEGPKFRPPISEVVQDLNRMVQVINKEDGESPST